MKQVKTVLVVIALLIGISIPQVTNAQSKTRKVTLEYINLLKECDVSEDIIDKTREYYEANVELDSEIMEKIPKLGKKYEMYIKKKQDEEELKKKQDELNKQQKEWEQLPVNLVGKWINEDSDKQTFEYHADSTLTFRNAKGFEYTVKGTDITYPVKAWIFHYTWKREGNVLTEIQVPKTDYILGDISFYPADIQKRIKEDIESRKNDSSLKTTRYIILSFSPEAITFKKEEGEDKYSYVRDISNMSTQEKNEYNKEIENWNKIKKEKEQKEYLAALERDNLKMAKLKAKAVASGDQYDYWFIGHLYEFGEGNPANRLYTAFETVEIMKTTICLDSALVWYKKAAAIDPKNEKYVTAVTHKIKTGRDYYEDKEKSDLAAKKEQIAQVCAAYTKKYGASNSNYLSKQGTIVKGMSIAFIREYINDFNQIGFYALTKQLLLRLQEYQPTQRDMMQFGRAVKSYKLISGSEPIWSFLVLNGKVVSVTKMSDIFFLISMNEHNLK